MSTELPCQTGQPDLWFAERPEVLARAQVLCRSCPIRRECLADALRRHEPWGVWGGRIVQRGVVVASKRGRGRPRRRTATSSPAASSPAASSPAAVR